MERREFVRAAVAGVAVGAAGSAMGQAGTTARTGREFYQLRKYALRNGPQTALCQGYFERALIPALGRMGMGPVGAFKLDVGPETPTYYVLIPTTDAAALVGLDARLRFAQNDDRFGDNSNRKPGGPQTGSPGFCAEG